eukprot:XP_011441973.1 PREDICTED: uncharacterized protein LOC105338506 [Crassostrea gigas]
MMSSVNPVFHSLGFGQDHDYNSANMPVQQVYNNRQCGFNCVCCARMLLGNYCPCAFPKQSVSTQTDSFDALPLSMSKENLWTRGTSEHSTMQRLINNTIEKYSLKNARDSHLSAAVKEVKNYICASTTVGGVDDKKIAERMKRTLQWKRYYSRKRTHAAEKGIGIRDLFKRRKSLGDEKENLLPKAVDEDLHDIGIENRAYVPSDSDSDSDIPLSALASKKK